MAESQRVSGRLGSEETNEQLNDSETEALKKRMWALKEELDESLFGQRVLAEYDGDEAALAKWEKDATAARAIFATTGTAPVCDRIYVEGVGELRRATPLRQRPSGCESN